MNLTRLILALLITLTILPLCSETFNLVSNINFDYNEVNDELALVDLRRIMLLAYDLDVRYDEINFIYQDKDYSLAMNNNNLVLSPGYQLFIADVDELYFEIRNNCVYVIYQRKNKNYEKVISSAAGFYLDEFFDCHDDSDDDIDVQVWLYREM